MSFEAMLVEADPDGCRYLKLYETLIKEWKTWISNSEKEMSRLVVEYLLVWHHTTLMPMHPETKFNAQIDENLFLRQYRSTLHLQQSEDTFTIELSDTEPTDLPLIGLATMGYAVNDPSMADWVCTHRTGKKTENRYEIPHEQSVHLIPQTAWTKEEESKFPAHCKETPKEFSNWRKLEGDVHVFSDLQIRKYDDLINGKLKIKVSLIYTRINGSFSLSVEGVDFGTIGHLPVNIRPCMVRPFVMIVEPRQTLKVISTYDPFSH